jgi:hypothetical protein
MFVKGWRIEYLSPVGAEVDPDFKDFPIREGGANAGWPWCSGLKRA